MTLIENKTKHPPPHAKYLVSREGWMFVATPCYGMHQPWWVSAVCVGSVPDSYTTCRETDPVAMLDTDKWVPMKEVLEALT
jgi:hypothetical protein